jgi:hypothetical protein
MEIIQQMKDLLGSICWKTFCFFVTNNFTEIRWPLLSVGYL